MFKIPDGMTEAETMAAIETVANGLAHKFKFGYYDAEDIKQEARFEAIIAMDRFDPSKGNKLHTFLWSHVWNRLFNLRRNKYERNDKPCLNCPLMAYDPNLDMSHSGCTEFEDKDSCQAYRKWKIRSSSKKNIVSPANISNVVDSNESNMSEDSNVINKIYIKSIVKQIDENIPNNMRTLWIKFKNDVKMSKLERENLIIIIREIVNGKKED